MTLQALHTSNDNRPGFTIVELMLTIIIVAILALIVTVGYPSIIQTSNARAWSAAGNQWTDLLHSDLALNGSTIPDASVHCLGNSIDNFPANSVFAAGECLKYDGPDPQVPDSVLYDQSIINTFPYRSSFPSGDLPQLGPIQIPGGGVLYVRGVTSAHSVEASGDRHLVLWYYIPGKDNCGQAFNEWEAFTSLAWSGCKRDINLDQ